MANQPTKYKKFVATAATATLVASAIVPVASAASFSDVSETNSHAEAINALVEQGIIKGYEDGTFKPTATLTRGHVVKMLGKWVEAQGFEVPADWNTVARFSDLKVDAKDQELVKYAAVVKDAGVFIGSNGALNASGSITRENMALTLDRAYSAVFGQSLVEEAAGLKDLTVSDLATAKAEAREEIQALRNLEISNVDTFNPKAAVNRAQFASFLYRTINVSEGETTTPETGEVKIASLKASKANELTVEFNKAVDTNAAAFAVKQGTTTDVKVKNVKWNEAGTVATLEVETKFVDATYNLTVTGLAEEALTASVTTTKEVATEIKFNNDKLVLTGKKDKDEDAVEARITFEIYNQYGEIVTDKTSESYYSRLKLKGIDTKTPVGVSGVTEEVYFDTQHKGTIIAWIDKREKEGETGSISFTYEFGEVDIDVDQDVVLSDDMEPGSVTFVKDIYSVDGYAFNSKNVEKYGQNVKQSNSTTTLQDQFFLLLEVKDQFGNVINAKGADKDYLKGTSGDTIATVVADGLRLSVSEDEIFDLDERNLTVKNVDGKYYFAIPLEFEFNREGYVEQAGENTVSARSKATGEVNEAKYSLEGSSKIYSIGLSAPAEVVASDEKVKLPVTVLDQGGQEVTDVALLNKSLKAETIDGQEYAAKLKISGDTKHTDFTFIKEDGKVYLEFRSIVNDDDKKSEDMDIEIEVVDTRQESEITLKVQPAAYATTLVKLADGVNTNLYEGNKFELKLSHFVVEDQYGRVMDEVDDDKFFITAEKTSDANLGAAFESGSKKAHYATTTDAASLAAKSVAKFMGLAEGSTIAKTSKHMIKAGDKGSAVFEFKLYSNDNEKKLVTSSITTTFRTLASDSEAFASYKVKGEKLGYFGTTADSVNIEDKIELKVVGVTSSGREVELNAGTAYTVLTNKYFKDANGEPLVDYDNKGTKTLIGINKGKAEDKLKEDDLVNSFETGIQIVINRTGETLTHAVKLSKEDRDYVALSLEDDASLTGKDLTELKVGTKTAVDGKKVVDTGLYFTALKNVADVIVTDQYGLKYEEKAADSTVTVDDLLKDTEFKFTISNVNSTNDKYVITNNGRPTANIKGVDAGDSFDLTIKIGDAVKTIKVRVQ